MSNNVAVRLPRFFVPNSVLPSLLGGDMRFGVMLCGAADGLELASEG